MVAYYFPPEFSGAGKQALALSLQLIRRGYKVLVVSTAGKSGYGRRTIRGVSVYRVPRLELPVVGVLFFWLCLAMVLFLRRNYFDVIHAHGANVEMSIVGVLGRILGKKSLVKITSARGETRTLAQGRYGRTQLYCLTLVDRYVAISREIQEELVSSPLSNEKIVYIPNGVETGRYRPPSEGGGKNTIRKELGLPDRVIISYVGRVTDRKGVGQLLESVAVLRGKWRNRVHVLLVGPPPMEEDASLSKFLDLRRLRPKCSWITWTGSVENVCPYLQASDIFVFPSRKEGLSNALLEAMACGLACIVSKVSGSTDIVLHEENGFLLDDTSVASLATQVDRVVSDSALRAVTGKRARETIVRGYVLKHVAHKYERLYMELCKPALRERRDIGFGAFGRAP